MNNQNGHRPDLEIPITLEEAAELFPVWLKEVPWFAERHKAAHAAVDDKYVQWLFDTINASIEGGNDLRMRGVIPLEVSQKETGLPHE